MQEDISLEEENEVETVGGRGGEVVVEGEREFDVEIIDCSPIPFNFVGEDTECAAEWEEEDVKEDVEEECIGEYKWDEIVVAEVAILLEMFDGVDDTI